MISKNVLSVDDTSATLLLNETEAGNKEKFQKKSLVWNTRCNTVLKKAKVGFQISSL